MDQTIEPVGRVVSPAASTREAVSEAAQAAPAFPSPAAREIVRDLMKPKLALYWADFLLHITLGWAAFGLALAFAPFSLGQIGCAVVAALALYRAVIFIHELAHRREASFEPFRRVWNLLCGFPLLVPSFTYHGVHNDHHTRNIYGLAADGEYVDFALAGRGAVLRYPFLSFVLPLVLIVRFLVFAPLSLLHPAIRRLVWERCSSLAIDMGYRRRPASERERRIWNRYEVITALYAATAIGLGIAGVLPLAFFGLWYGVAVLIFWLNSIRTLVAHRYLNPSDHPMALEEQFLDSVDVPGHPVWTALWAPVGLRFHATHHLFPSLPYHALGEAHRRLTTRLPESGLYRSASRKSLWDALSTLWRDAGPEAVRAEVVTG